MANFEQFVSQFDDFEQFISQFADFEQFISHFADFEQVIIKNCHFAVFEQAKKKKLTAKFPWEKPDTYAFVFCLGYCLMSPALHPGFSDQL